MTSSALKIDAVRPLDKKKETCKKKEHTSEDSEYIFHEILDIESAM